MKFHSNLPMAAEPASRSIGELTAILVGTVVMLIFMISSIAHAYVNLELIPSLPFVRDEIAGLLLASGLSLFNWSVFRILFGRWTTGTAAAHFFLLLCVTVVLSLELNLTLSAILKPTADDFVIDAERRLDSLLVTADRVDQQMTSGYLARIDGLDERQRQAAAGNDVSREAKCHEICRLALLHRDALQSGFLPLKDHIVTASPNGGEDLNGRMSRLRSAMRALYAKHQMFLSFDRMVQQQEAETQRAMTKYVDSVALKAAAHPALAAYTALAADVRQMQEEVFQGKDSITEQAMLLRLTAETLLRCLALRGAVSDYIAMTIALALVMLVPAFSVARKLWQNRELQESDLSREIQRALREKDLYNKLARARSERGQAKMQAAFADKVWEHQAAAVQARNYGKHPEAAQSQDLQLKKAS